MQCAVNPARHLVRQPKEKHTHKKEWKTYEERGHVFQHESADLASPIHKRGVLGACSYEPEPMGERHQLGAHGSEALGLLAAKELDAARPPAQPPWLLWLSVDPKRVQLFRHPNQR